MVSSSNALRSGVDNPVSPIGFEIMWCVLFVLLAVFLIYQTRRRGELSIMALSALTGMTLFWQEFYQDWGGYLLYSPKLLLLPWHATLWTTPNKPAFVVISYFVFYGVAFAGMLGAVDALRRFFPSVPMMLMVIIIAPTVMYAINMGQEYQSVASGYWSYVYTIGPAQNTGRGTQPFLWPSLQLMFMGAAITLAMAIRDQHGRPRFERIAHPDRFEPGWKREAIRVVTWVTTLNLIMMTTMTVPLIVVREVFGKPSPLVP